MVKKSAAKQGGDGCPGSGRCPGGGHDSPSSILGWETPGQRSLAATTFPGSPTGGHKLVTNNSNTEI